MGTAKIEDSVLKDAKVVAFYKGITLTEYLTEMIRSLVKRGLMRQADQEDERVGGGLTGGACPPR